MNYSRKINWFEIRDNYLKGVISSMYRNLSADLDCGYSPFSRSIVQQKELKDLIATTDRNFYNELMEKYTTRYVEILEKSNKLHQKIFQKVDKY